MTNDAIAQVADAMLQHSACIILTHINPEGDAIGSQLALAAALEQRGIQVDCFVRDGVPENCRFLPACERVRQTLPETLPQLVIFVDADRIERCGVAREDFRDDAVFVRIDHHVSNAVNLGPALVDTTAAAAGELVYAVLPYLGAKLTPDIATCLLTALMVDTGRFSYSNTTPTTHRIAAELVAAGANTPLIVEWTWGRVKYEAAKLVGFALSSLTMSEDMRIAWAVLRDNDFRRANAQPEDTEGIIDAVRNIKDTEVAALFSEKRGEVRVSLRSHGRVDVAALASEFGGGGHVKAAGLTFDGTIDDAVNRVITAIQRRLG